MANKLSLNTNGSKWTVSLDSAPNIGSGFSAPIGSEAFVIDGGVGSAWIKFGPNDKDWRDISDESFDNLVTPLILGGSDKKSSITYQTTTAVGEKDSDHIFKVGNNGDIEALRISHVGDATFKSLILCGGSLSSEGTPNTNDILKYDGSKWVTSQSVTGPQGITGLRGITGLIGSTGLNGIQGITGLIGSTGINGIQGITGLIGSTGINGIQGITGLIGSTGINGIQGITGLIGSTGISGIQGITGLIGSTGINGIQGITGLVGSTGINGIQGETGLIGFTGTQGITGPVALTNGEVTSSVAITTTNTGTRTLLTGFTNTPTAGTYLFIFSGKCTHSAASGTVNISLFIGGVEKADSVRSAQNPSNGTATRAHVVSTNGKITVNGSQAVELRWNITTNGTGTMTGCTMNWIKVG